MKPANTGFSILSAAILGAAAMYILDPEAGERRRHAIAAGAGDALRGTGDRLGDAWEHAHKLGSDLISQAHDLGGHLADHARAGAADAASHLSAAGDQAGDLRDQAVSRLKGLQDRVADLGQELIGRARQAAGKARDSASQAQQDAWESTHPLRHRIAKTLDPEHTRGPGHAVAWSGAGMGAVALGAGVMYFFDPEKGQERRDMVVGQVSRCVQETGHFCRLAGQYVTRIWNGRGSAAEPRLEAANPLAGEQLVQRVRSEISHLLANPAQVQLMADANGMVTLYGKIPAAELDPVLLAISSVPGVRSVLDRLDVPAQAEPREAPSPTETATQR